MSSRESSLLHRPATEPVPEETLAGMERDGWTPTQVRALIASYRLLARDVRDLREETGLVGHGFVKTHKPTERRIRYCFEMVEKELRQKGIGRIDLSDHTICVSRPGEGDVLAERAPMPTLFGAVELLGPKGGA